MLRFYRIPLVVALLAAAYPAMAQSSPYVFRVTAQGVAVFDPPSITSLSGTAVNFGTVNNLENSDRSIVIRNTGGPASVSLSALSAPYSVLNNGCSSPLQKEGQCTIVVRFTPQNTGAAPNQNLVVSATGAAVPVTIALSGAGQAVNYTIPLTFGQTFKIPTGATSQSLSYSFSANGTTSESLYRNGVSLSTGGSACCAGGTRGYIASSGLLAGDQYSYYFYGSGSISSYSLTLRYTR